MSMSKEEKVKSDVWVIIKNGKMEAGRIDKAGVGSEDGKIIRKLETLLSSNDLCKFIDQVGRLGNAFVMRRGLSLGISDLDIAAHARKKIEEEIIQSQKGAESLIKKYEKKELKILTGLTAKESLEAQIMNTLANGVSHVSEIVREHIVGNDMLVMANSGAKGSLINMTQMAAVVGQETIVGQRITRGYHNRTLTHFVRGDLTPKSHGFVSRGFKQGLSPF